MKNNGAQVCVKVLSATENQYVKLPEAATWYLWEASGPVCTKTTINIASILMKSMYVFLVFIRTILSNILELRYLSAKLVGDVLVLLSACSDGLDRFNEVTYVVCNLSYAFC